jgi:hypothetical protein
MGLRAIGLAVAIGWLERGDTVSSSSRAGAGFPYRWRNSQLTRED